MDEERHISLSWWTLQPGKFYEKINWTIMNVVSNHDHGDGHSLVNHT